MANLLINVHRLTCTMKKSFVVVKKSDTSNKHVDVIRSNSLKVYSTIAVKTRKNHTSSGFYSA